ncbi:complement C1q-like protein 3 [Ostrea edulis]|uniref:complement C1q-like protein 3 n=1 Tax=Ostrea edulis TaxID=37623 RepID=UPI0024AEA1B6|nr:complement C1q-like protein 3 [Ostrea edulis]
MNMSPTIKDLQVRDRYLSLSVLDVHNETATLKSSLEEHQKSTKLQIQNSSLSMYNEITKVNDSLSNLRRACTGSNVAFTAGAHGLRDKYTVGQTVIFGRVVYQVGGGYNPTTGVFTAPKAGLYLIFCTVVANYGHTFWTTIKINGSTKTGVMAYNPESLNIYQSASNLVVYHLEAGDRVWIQLYSGDTLYSGFPDSTFSVTLINGSE